MLTLETKLDYPVDSGVFLRVGETGESHQVTLDYRPDGDIGSILQMHNGRVILDHAASYYEDCSCLI